MLLNTNVSPKAFISLLSLKYVKLRAVVVSIVINMPSSLVRGLQHIFIFSSHIYSTWWKAIQIIKCVLILLLLQSLQKDLQIFWIFEFFRIRSIQIFSTAATHEIRLTRKNFSSLSSAGRSPLYNTNCFVNKSSNKVWLPKNFRFSSLCNNGSMVLKTLHSCVISPDSLGKYRISTECKRKKKSSVRKDLLNRSVRR